MSQVTCLDSAHGQNWTALQGDCIDVLAQMPPSSVDFSVFSPPFSSLYIYSESERDMGNTADDAEFAEQYGHLARELHRVTRPGRLCAVHCKDLVYYRTSSAKGTSGLRDFPGDLIRAHTAAGWDYHSRVTIWKDPVIEMQRTKAHGLLYKQLQADSSFSRQGLAEYMLIFRRWPESETEETSIRPVGQDRAQFPLDQWQCWASPVWMDIQQTNVLNTELARESEDEKHICPLQLDLIERCIRLWSNPGDVVFSPFMGIGSEGVTALKCKRKFLGTELKESYWRQACRFLAGTEAQAASLFDLMVA